MEIKTTKKSQILVENYFKMLSNMDREKTNAYEKSDILNEFYKDPDIVRIVNRMVESVFSTTSTAVDQWENIKIPELDGLTPIEYYDTLNSMESLVELVSFFMKNNNSVPLPSNLKERIKKTDASSVSFLHNALADIKPVAGDDLSKQQKAILTIVDILLLPEFIDDLICLIEKLDFESHKKIIRGVTLTLTDIGEPALDKLVQVVEDTRSYPDESKRALYVISLAKIASERKSERIYRLLKDYFRKCEIKYKVSASGLLALYGDRRSVTMIREYVDRNKEHISKEEYKEFRRNIVSLGGIPGDLDYSYIDKTDLESKMKE